MFSAGEVQRLISGDAQGNFEKPKNVTVSLRDNLIIFKASQREQSSHTFIYCRP